MNRKVITNAVQSEMPSDLKAEAGKALVINLAPPGEYPQTIDDPDAEGGRREVNQILDDQAIDTLIKNFKDKVLVDADHSSETSTDTKAMAWVTRLFKDPEKGLMAEIEPTSIGADNINGKVYRFVSGAWTLDDDGRPVELVSIGLTNRPNLPVSPIINSTVPENGTAGASSATADECMTQDEPSATGPTDVEMDTQTEADPENGSQTTTNTDGTEESEEPYEGENMDINAVKELFGLPAEATDEELRAAIEAVLAKCEGMEAVQNALGLEPTSTNEEVSECLNAVLENCGDLQAQNEEAEEARLNAEADQLIAENEDVIPEESVEEIRNEYVEDPEAAKETVANMRRVYERAVANASRGLRSVRTPVVNFKSARKPTALNMESVLADCDGDPEKENAKIRAMNAKR